MSDAFCDAELPAAAVDDGLSGRQPLPDALQQYEARRDARAMPDYELNLRAAHLENDVPAEELMLRAALRDNPTARARFLAGITGVNPAAELFAPQNLQRIMLQALMREGAPA